MKGNQQELAKILGVSRETVRLRVKDGALPGLGPDGKYDFPAAVAAWLRFQVGLALASSGSGDDADQRERYDRLRADLLELDLHERRAETSTAERYAQQVGDSFDRVAAKLKALDNRLAPAVVGCTSIPDALARIAPLTREVWEELYRADDVPDEADEPE